MRTQANGIEIEYDTFGSTDGDPLLLIMGLGAQMTLWDDAFCELLASHGHYTIRFDNRDVGLSTWFDDAGLPDMVQLMIGASSGETVSSPYTLDDMADDAAGLLDALSIDRAHVVGASMGGMIAQAFAIRHPGRLHSLVSIMSSTGHPESPQAKPEVMGKLMAPPPETREGRIEQSLDLWRAIGSPGFELDEARIRERSGRDYDRAFHPQGTVRQMAAIVAGGSREENLAALTVPTLVIHGAADPLVPVAGGHDTAATIPGAQLRIVEGMGHDLPPGVWDEVVPVLADHTAKHDSI
jgi:pimeloyl-ACP methyl ester carboxylesterase